MNLLLYTPIMIVIVILALVFFIDKWVTKRTTKAGSRSNYNKRLQRLVIGYVVLLLVATGLFYLLPNRDPVTAKKVQTKPPELYEAAKNGRIDRVDQAEVNKDYMKKKWTLKADTDQLTIQGADAYETPIVVDETDDSGQSIKVRYYQTEMYANGVDVSRYIKPVQVQMLDGRLVVRGPEDQSVDVSAFKQEFPIMQFTDETWMDEHDMFHPGDQFLYVELPKHVRLDNNENTDGWIERVDHTKH